MPLRVAGARCGWPAATPLSGPARRDPWAAGAPQAAALRLAWRVAERTGAGVRTGWSRAPALAASHRAGWQSARPLSAPAQRVPWGWLPAHARASRLPWAAAHALAAPSERLPWGIGRAATSPVRLAWQPATARARHARLAWGSATAHTAGVRLPWWREFSPITAGVRGPWDHEPEPVDTVLIPLRLVYRMLHSITIRPLGDTAELPCASVTITHDADSWAYSVEVDILGRSQWQRVAPVAGEPIECELIIDGHTWRVLIEACEGTHTHARLPVGRARGRSLSARLAGEYSAARDYTETAARTLAQLADQELPPTGWTLDWQCADWTVPAGAWSYQSLPPIAAMARVVEAAGGILVPDRNAQTLVALPRWPVLPWAFAGATPAVEIPLEVLSSATEALPVPGDPADAVYVIGGDVGGVLGWVKRTGSAGDRLLSPISDPLATAEAAARARGARALADQWPAPAYTGFTLPLSPVGGDFPLLELGQLVSLTGSSTPVRGIVSSVTITGRASQRGGLVVEQQIGLGARSRNAYAAWRRLTAPEPLQPATITTDLGSGRYLAALAIGGAEIPVRGTATVGATVWVRGGRIEGEAPGLAGYSVEV